MHACLAVCKLRLVHEHHVVIQLLVALEGRVARKRRTESGSMCVLFEVKVLGDPVVHRVVGYDSAGDYRLGPDERLLVSELKPLLVDHTSRELLMSASEPATVYAPLSADDEPVVLCAGRLAARNLLMPVLRKHGLSFRPLFQVSAHCLVRMTHSGGL
jgi:hypothetical protein